MQGRVIVAHTRPLSSKGLQQMTHAELPLKGRCLCGSVQIELTSMPLLTLACHCKGCQKCSASALFPDRHVPDA
ncbi:MAG: GFA family protein [Paracoccaceae bacterium]